MSSSLLPTVPFPTATPLQLFFEVFKSLSLLLTLFFSIFVSPHTHLCHRSPRGRTVISVPGQPSSPPSAQVKRRPTAQLVPVDFPSPQLSLAPTFPYRRPLLLPSY
ncbi:uncharacterized protein BP01DRAFT_16697 [Aspergillus saccharolyticus JOP 1030-1]|uniref:Uncharacterized protein n=1 Tax=Aspergillus saccharolyticus JOP 1030-1 TaxID=1450539 RepID=A0A319AIN2_9EURO|nr:hypothetical protein BP01DRAFT_16697 [Aspergillus saccharolyticus JOP 1030-1]PYH46522.1 hypothetical protein BP01DRAFT_16697 [Aspergillus saccharolyticus JOP 1030-1]